MPARALTIGAWRLALTQVRAVSDRFLRGFKDAVGKLDYMALVNEPMQVRNDHGLLRGRFRPFGGGWRLPLGGHRLDGDDWSGRRRGQ